MLVGQLAVLGNGVIDTVMAGQRSATDLAIVGLGASIYISIFVGFRGVLTGLAPIVAGHFGGGRLHEIGNDVGQAVWVGLLLALIGMPLLLWTDPWMAIIRPDPNVVGPLSSYLHAIAIALPATMMFSIFFILNSATSRPAITMAVNLAALALKWPLNLICMDGIEGWLAPMGAVGCAVSTAILAWLSMLAALALLAADRRYREFRVRISKPQKRRIGELLRIGVPIGIGTMIEVTSFTLMALLIGSFGIVASASHQVAANVATIAFMIPMALSNATSVLAAQAIGARNESGARAWVFTGMWLVLAIATAVTLLILLLREPIAAFYAQNPEVRALASELIILAAICHVLDAFQCLLYSVLRAWRITLRPMLVYGVSLWGLGVGGGWVLATIVLPPDAGAARGFWVGNFAGLLCACIGLWLLLRSRLVDPVHAIKP
jgi:MATE family multidrug resistance protein